LPVFPANSTACPIAPTVRSKPDFVTAAIRQALPAKFFDTRHVTNETFPQVDHPQALWHEADIKSEPL
jgi:hypothetical protein